MQDVPGVTRDRIAYDAVWGGRRFTLVDTGGWEPDARGLQARVTAQAQRAVQSADVVLFVVDGHTGATETDLVVARTLRRGAAPVVLAVTKVDDERGEADAAELWSHGPGRAARGQRAARPGQRRPARRHGGRVPGRADGSDDDEEGPRRVALIGQPNVGKSSLLNRLTGEERSVVDAVAGTTIDPVDSLLELDGEIWRFVDTAGLRRKVRHGQRHGVLREPAHRSRDRVRRGRDRPAGRVRAAGRTGPAGDRRRSSTPAALWSSRSTSGTWSTRTAATDWTARSTATWPGSPGRRG